MKNAIQFIKLLLIGVIILSLQACPVGLAYPLTKAGTNPIDKDLAGKWRVLDEEDPEIITAQIIKADKNTYRIEVLEKGSMYSLEGSIYDAWVTEMNGTQFIIAQNQMDEQYYHYAYKVEGDRLTTWDMSLLVGGVDAVTSVEALQAEVKASMNQPDFLTSEKHWERE